MTQSVSFDAKSALDAVIAATGSFREGESPVVTAARGVVRDHERDPADGTVRTFGGRDEARLASAIGRIESVSDVASMTGSMKADVAIQSLAATLQRSLGSGLSDPTGRYDAADLRAVHGDTIPLKTMGSTELGNLAMGRFNHVMSDTADWIAETKRFAGVEASTRAADGPGASMARIGGFASKPGGLLSQAGSLDRASSPSSSLGPTPGMDLSGIARSSRDAGR